MVSALARKCLTRGRGSALIRVLRLRASACLVVAPGRGGSAAVRLAFDDADDDVPEESEAKTAHDLPGQPAGNRADDQHDDNAVYSNHDVLPDTAGHERPAATLRCSLGCNLESLAQVDQTVSNRRRAGGQGRQSRALVA